MRIWKFYLQLIDDQLVSMPPASKILHVGVQSDSLCLWALVDHTQPSMNRRIVICGTGYPAELVLGLPHIGTVFWDGFVWHVFDGGPE